MFILQTEKYVLKKVVKAIFFNCEFDAASEAALIYSWMDRVQRCESTELKVGLCVNSSYHQRGLLGDPLFRIP